MLKFKLRIISHVVMGIAVFTACSQDERLTGPLISFSIPTDGFKVELGKSLPIVPTIVNGEKSDYTWEVNGEVVSSAKLFLFTPSKIGNYNLQLKVSNEVGTDLKMIQVTVFSSFSPYITKVFDYKYGPGQHASMIPSGWKGNDFIGQPWTGNKLYTSLGGWGGYIIAGFDHTIKNVEGADFAIFTQPGVSSEPGVVFVMFDANSDGLPNDGDWAGIKGSEYNHPETIHDYRVTYYKPAGNGTVTWKDNKGGSGNLLSVFESGSWWWSGYGDQTEVSFSGVRLPDAYTNISTQPDSENWIVRPGMFSFGYAECYNNSDYNISLRANMLDISMAVGKTGDAANLTGISFIKVQSGVFQIPGWLNESSTEISGAADLALIEYSAN